MEFYENLRSTLLTAGYSTFSLVSFAFVILLHQNKASWTDSCKNIGIKIVLFFKNHCLSNAASDFSIRKVIL
jgi:hypothetical protein